MKKQAIPFGTIFNGVMFIEDVFHPKRRHSLFRCKCGQEFVASTTTVLSKGRTCKCNRKPSPSKSGKDHPMYSHGMTHSREYTIWLNVKARCKNVNRPDYVNYGGRGISYCKTWDIFENFYKDMGICPSGFTLDRKNNDEGYSKDNCQWKSRKDQNRNKRSNRLITNNGVTKPLCDWLEERKVSRSCFYKKQYKGMSVEDILFHN